MTTDPREVARNTATTLIKVLEAVVKFEQDDNRFALLARVRKALDGYDYAALADAVAAYTKDLNE